MSSAVLIRKELLTIWQENILPELRRGSSPRIVLAQLPPSVPPGVAMQKIEHPVLVEADAQKHYPEAKRWSDIELHAVRCPVLFCVIEGEADLRMGVTDAMLEALPPRERRRHTGGGYTFSLPSLSYFLVPPGVPQDTSFYVPWFRSEPHRGVMRLLSVRVLPVGALCHCSVMKDGVYKVNYSLFIEDAQLLPALGILQDELGGSIVDYGIVQAQLLTLMLRLQRGMTVRVPQMTDGLYSRFPDNEFQELPVAPSSDPLVAELHRYVQLHLHKSLTVAELARHVRLSPTQLNRLLRRHTGLSTMSYVMHRRIETARLLLSTSDQSVQEIAQIVGFSNPAHFSRTFAEQAGMPPLKFRRQNALAKDAVPQLYRDRGKG